MIVEIAVCVGAGALAVLVGSLVPLLIQLRKPVAGFVPTLVMDAWEYAFILDYRLSERGEYVDAFFSNINWKVLDDRVTCAQAAGAAHHA